MEMSKSIKTGLVFLPLLAALLSGASSALPQERIPVSQETILTFAHDLLQVFYPELFNKNHRVSFCVTTPGDNPWVEIPGVYFTVTPADVNPLQKLISPHPETTDHILLGGLIWLPPMQYGRVQELRAYSDAVHEQQLDALRNLVESHPEWSDAQAADALKKAGARFGPSDKEAFINSLPFSKTERFLGRLKIESVDFEYPDPKRTGEFASGALIWIVRAVGELPDGTHPRYGFSFEPFEGKLTSIFQSLGR
jgi:hypothetical protein